MKTNSKQGAGPLFAVLFWLFVWAGLSAVVGNSLLLPNPVQVGQTLLSLVGTKAFWQVCANTLGNIFAGFLASFLLGVLLSFLAYEKRAIRLLLHPFVQVLKVAPQASFIMLFLVWVKGEILSVVMAVVMVFPVLYASLLEGFFAVDEGLLAMAQVYEFTKWQRVRYVLLPSLAPFLLAAYKVGLSMAFKVAVASEVIGVVRGSVGKEMYEAKLYLDTPLLFAWTVVVIAFGFLVEKLGLYAVNHFGKTRRLAQKGKKTNG